MAAIPSVWVRGPTTGPCFLPTGPSVLRPCPFCMPLIVRVMARTESRFSSQRLPSRVQARNDVTPASWAACRSSAQASSKSASCAGESGTCSVSTAATGMGSAAAGLPRQPRRLRSPKIISPLSKPGCHRGQGSLQFRYPAEPVPWIPPAPEGPVTPSERPGQDPAEQSAAPNDSGAL